MEEYKKVKINLGEKKFIYSNSLDYSSDDDSDGEYHIKYIYNNIIGFMIHNYGLSALIVFIFNKNYYCVKTKHYTYTDNNALLSKEICDILIERFNNIEDETIIEYKTPTHMKLDYINETYKLYNLNKPKYNNKRDNIIYYYISKNNL
jgi:hypothetical protein